MAALSIDVVVLLNRESQSSESCTPWARGTLGEGHPRRMEQADCRNGAVTSTETLGQPEHYCVFATLAALETCIPEILDANGASARLLRK
jgi:hypothetical protein